MTILLVRRPIAFFLWLLFSSTGAFCADPEVSALLEEARAAEVRFDVPSALEIYRKIDALQPNNPVILQKISKQLSDGSEDVKDPRQRKKQVEEALVYSQRALALAPHNPVYLLSMAVCYGKLTAFADNQTKINYSRLVKRYAEEALAADPTYDWAHHVLGRWNYEIAQVGGPARAAARLLYGGLPAGSCAEAIKHLEKAVELNGAVPAHHIELGFAYLSCGDKTRATTQFEQGIALPSLEKHDEANKARARALLQKWGR